MMGTFAHKSDYVIVRFAVSVSKGGKGRDSLHHEEPTKTRGCLQKTIRSGKTKEQV